MLASCQHVTQLVIPVAILTRTAACWSIRFVEKQITYKQ